MVVDDEPMILRTTSSILEACGYTVIAVAEGGAAVDIFRERHGEIDGVLLDLAMPGMSGQEIYRRFREIDPEVRVLLVSGLTGDGEGQSPHSGGRKGFYKQAIFYFRDIPEAQGNPDLIKKGGTIWI